MGKDKKELISFGFGLALLIPYFVMLHGLEHKIGFVKFAIGLILLLVVITNVERIKLLYFLLAAALYLKTGEGALHHGMGFLPVLFLVLAVSLLVISCAKIEALEPVFQAWMKAAHILGTVFTGLILCVLFYLVFAPVGIVLRILRKDLLDQRIEPGKATYWQKREAKPFDPESYQQQF